MKIYKKAILLLSAISTLVGCQDLDKLNENPNNIKDAEPYLLLTNVERSAFAMPGISKEYASRMIIMTDGENAYQFFKWTSGSFDKYEKLVEIQKMMEQAESRGEEAYVALGHFLKAKMYYDLTLTFGDIPFSESLKGEQDIQFPKYDTQEEVFDGILRELELASAKLDTSDIIKGDIIYEGDLTRWKKLISSFKLKVLMSLSNKENVKGMAIAQKFKGIYQGEVLMESNLDNGQLKFYDVAGSRYPQFNSSSYGSSMYMSSTFVDLLQELKDPRLFIYAQQTAKALEEGRPISDFDSYNGGDPIVPYAENEKLVQTKNISKINSRYYADPTTEPNFILSYAELQFILAEASARGWISGDTKGFYERGIKASFSFYEKNAKQLGSYCSLDAVKQYLVGEKVAFKGGDINIELEQILTQKYIMMFHQSGWTAYYDYLRTGFPKLKIQEGVTAPTRWLYPNTEYNRNGNNLKEALQRQFGGDDNIRGSVWWLK